MRKYFLRFDTGSEIWLPVDFQVYVQARKFVLSAPYSVADNLVENFGSFFAKGIEGKYFTTDEQMEISKDKLQRWYDAINEWQPEDSLDRNERQIILDEMLRELKK